MPTLMEVLAASLRDTRPVCGMRLLGPFQQFVPEKSEKFLQCGRCCIHQLTERCGMHDMAAGRARLCVRLGVLGAVGAANDR